MTEDELAFEEYEVDEFLSILRDLEKEELMEEYPPLSPNTQRYYQEYSYLRNIDFDTFAGKKIVQHHVPTLQTVCIQKIVSQLPSLMDIWSLALPQTVLKSLDDFITQMLDSYEVDVVKRMQSLKENELNYLPIPCKSCDVYFGFL